MTTRSTTGSIYFITTTAGQAIAHSTSTGGGTGGVVGGSAVSSSEGTAYTPGFFGTSDYYQSTWENPIAINTLSKYLTSIPANDSKKIVGLLEDNARSLEDHLDTAYLKTSGGTVYGATTLAGDVNLLGTVTVETRPLISLLPPSGSITMFGGVAMPGGWLLCDGTAISRTTYPTLFSVIGSRFGAGDGSTTFNLPNFNIKYPIGSDNYYLPVGTTGGSFSTTIASGNLPTHTHTMQSHTHNLQNHTHDINGIDFPDHDHSYKVAQIATAGTNRAILTGTGSGAITGGINAGPLSGTVGSDGPSTNTSGTASTANTSDGGFANTALSIVPPYLAVNFIIKT